MAAHSHIQTKIFLDILRKQFWQIYSTKRHPSWSHTQVNASACNFGFFGRTRKRKYFRYPQVLGYLSLADTLSGGLFSRLLSDHQRCAQITGHSSLLDNLLSPVFEIRRVNFSSEVYQADDRLQQCRRVHNDVLVLFVISRPGTNIPVNLKAKTLSRAVYSAVG